MSDARARLDALLEDMRSRARPVRIVKKRGAWHQRAAAALLRAVTFGGQRTYLTQYVTTLGHTIYVPDGFEAWGAEEAYRVLRHELVHVGQFERYGWPAMVLVYGFLPLPALLAYGRARLEWEAYEETLRVAFEMGGAAEARRLRDFIVARFTGPDYGWMWPFPRAVGRWVDEAIDRLERGPSD